MKAKAVGAHVAWGAAALLDVAAEAIRRAANRAQLAEDRARDRAVGAAA